MYILYRTSPHGRPTWLPRRLFQWAASDQFPVFGVRMQLGFPILLRHVLKSFLVHAAWVRSLTRITKLQTSDCLYCHCSRLTILLFTQGRKWSTALLKSAWRINSKWCSKRRYRIWCSLAPDISSCQSVCCMWSACNSPLIFSRTFPSPIFSPLGVQSNSG